MEEQEISLQDIVGVLKKRWKNILFPSIIAALAATLLSFTIPSTFESYALLKVGYSGNRLLENIPTTREIMTSYPWRVEIAKKLNKEKDRDFIDSLKNNVFYFDSSSLLMIRATAKNPTTAATIVNAVTDIVIDRHQVLFLDAQKTMNTLIKYMREALQPLPIISSGINEFRIEPTKIEVPTILSDKPLASKKRMMVMVTFVSVMLLNILISFYNEGKER